MCIRSTDNNGFYYQNQNQKRNRLKIKAFYLRLLSISNIPQTITLHYLPRISGSPLEINDFKIRSDLDAFVTLHRVRSAEKSTKEVVFASRECVRVSEAVRFEVYLREDKVLKGIFRKDEEDEWKLECECALERGENNNLFDFEDDINEAEVSVVAEGHVAIIEKVDMRKRKKCRRSNGFKGFLDEIPEEREEGICDDCCFETEEMEICEEDDFHADVTTVSADVRGEADRDHIHNMEMEMEMEMDKENIRWAVDVGIWVMCFGVGLLVSKASSKRLTRRLIP